MPDEKYVVLYADSISPARLEWIEDLINDDTLEIISPDSDEKSDLMLQVPDAHVIIAGSNPVDANVITAAPKLKFIQKAGMRWENLDINAARKAGVTVAVIPLAATMGVAELAITLMLALSKNLIKAHMATAHAKYRSLGLEPKRTSQTSIAFQWMQIPGITELYKKTLGLIGLGEIGTAIACRAKSFDMKLLYYKRKRLDPETEKQLGIVYAPFEELLKESDFVNVSVPHTGATEKLIGGRELGMMKNTAFLINTCRGGVLDEDALAEALKEDKIAGAGLDVFLYEPLPDDSPLIGLDNVILTPHIGGGSGEPLVVRQTHDIFDNIKAALQGKGIRNVIS